jgi:hypothetical protein
MPPTQPSWETLRTEPAAAMAAAAIDPCSSQNCFKAPALSTSDSASTDPTPKGDYTPLTQPSWETLRAEPAAAMAAAAIDPCSSENCWKRDSHNPQRLFQDSQSPTGYSDIPTKVQGGVEDNPGVGATSVL